MLRYFPLICLLLGGLLAASPDHALEPPSRTLEVLFFGDDAYHHPLERYRLLKEVSGTRGLRLTYEKRMEALTTENLARFDALLIYANQQEIAPEQWAALKEYVEQGGGLVPVHCGSACFKKHDAYVDLVGGQIKDHGEGILTARIVEPEHPTMKGYTPFETWDETYRHHRLVADLTVLQRHGDEPWTWVRTQGRGRIFYTAHGHDERCWAQEGFHELLARGIRWAAGEGTTPPPLPVLEYQTPLLPEHYHADPTPPPVQEPLAPEVSLQLAQVPPECEISLFAAEPDVVRPIAMTWDERGRLWVVEALDYPNNLSPTGEGRDRLKICEDTDGDGKADRFTVFAEGLSIATSAVHGGGGVIAVDGRQIILLRDTDGDDCADERRVLFEGINTHDTHAGVSNLRFGFDGWIYATIGYAGFEGTVGGRPMRFDTGVFRFLPDGSALEFLGKTSNNTWGLGFTESGDVLGSTANRQASWQLVGDHGPARRADRGTRVFPITQDVQGSDGWDPPVEVLGPGRIRAKARHFTAAAGHAVYTGRLFPAEWWNSAVFVCEPTGHLVALGWLRAENADWITDFDGNNLYASADAWSSPIAAEPGPDGAVWIADWYNIIVQHNRPGAPFEHTKVERGAGAAYVTPLRDRPYGRIYRIFPKAKVTAAKVTPSASDWLAELTHDNLQRRLHAQRQLAESGRTDMVPQLVKAIEHSHGLHALHVLHALGYFSSDHKEGIARLAEIVRQHPEASLRRTALAIWPAEVECPFDPLKESDAFVLREWLLLLTRVTPSETLGRHLHGWFRTQPRLRQGEVLERCFAAAAAQHATGFLLAALEEPPHDDALANRVFSTVLTAFAETRSPQILARLENHDSALIQALTKAAAPEHHPKTHQPAASRLAQGEALYARACAACHQSHGRGLESAFPPLDGSPRVTQSRTAAAKIVLHGLLGPVEGAGRPTVNSLMPPVLGLSDAEVADVLTYIRHAWSNDAPEISPEEVAQIRAATKDRATPWTLKELEAAAP